MKNIWVYLPWLLLSAMLVANSNRDLYYEAEVLSEVRQKILANYVDKVTSQKLLQGALRGMMEELDDYSEYLDEDMLQQIYESTEGEFVGIGVVLSMENDFLTILSPIEDSPAAEVGILAGDRILMIDGDNTEGWTLEEAVAKLRGASGTTVRLHIQHEGEKITQDIVVTRATIQIRSIKNQKILPQSNIGYLRLTKFNKHTSSELDQAIMQLQEQGMKSLIIDLRFNPGGLMEAAVESVKLFVSDGIILYLKGRTPENYHVFRASSSAKYEKLPLVILLNKRSASASEIVAGALRDHQRATIVGERSYGKGLVQSILPLRDEKTAIKITTARYYTPSGKSIQKTKDAPGGIIPDIVCDISSEDEQKLMISFYQTKQQFRVEDVQLQRAIQFFSSNVK